MYVGLVAPSCFVNLSPRNVSPGIRNRYFFAHHHPQPEFSSYKIAYQEKTMPAFNPSAAIPTTNTTTTFSPPSITEIAEGSGGLEIPSFSEIFSFLFYFPYGLLKILLAMITILGGIACIGILCVSGFVLARDKIVEWLERRERRRCDDAAQELFGVDPDEQDTKARL